MSVRRNPKSILLALAVALLPLGPGAAALQAQDRVGGVIVDAATQRPVEGAQVAVEGTQIGGITDNRGRFLLLNVPGPRATLRVVMIGYRQLVREVEVGRTDLVLPIEESAIALDQIVVTGTAGEQQLRSIGNAVGSLSADDVEEIAPALEVHQMLSARVPGVRIMNTGGEIGTGGLMRIRGAKSMTLGANPLLYVDGVRVNGTDNLDALGGTGFDSGQQPSRINDFNPDDIERIEIVKGPAAATLYGTEASNGVIHIITKRGRSGSPRVDVTMKQGANWFENPEDLFPPVYYRCSGVSANAPVPPGGDAAAFDRYRCAPGQITEFHPLRYDREVFGREWFRTGHTQGYAASVTGGSETVTYYASGDFDRDEGALPYNWRNRLSGRANLSYTPREALKLDFSLGGISSKAQSASAQQPLSTAIIWACPSPGCEAGSGAPNAMDGPFRGYLAYLPEVYEDEIEGFQDVDRTTASLVTTHNPASWFNHRLSVGGDITNLRNSELYRATGSVGNLQNYGTKRIVNLRTMFLSLDYGANATFDLLSDLRGTTSGGVQFYRRSEESNFSDGQNFPLEALETVTSGSNRTGGEDFLENRTLGAFLQQQLAWRDRLFLTGAVRGDDNSAFGENFDFIVYPKVSASYVISEEPFLQGVGWLDALKLRGAWGRAGRQPDVFDALRTYEPTIGVDASAVLTPENIGNPDLQPEVGEELELGFDAGLLDGRLGLEFTYYDQRTMDAIVRVPVLPSLGFPGVQFRNIGEVKNYGIELGVDLTPWRTEDFGLDLRFTLSSNRNEVVSLGGQPPIVQNATFGEYHVEGFALGSTFLKRVVSADVVEEGGRNVATNVLCEGGERAPGTNFSAGGGAPVPCDQAPDVFWGQPVPKWEGGLGATLTLFRNFEIYALVDFIEGKLFNNNDASAAHRFFLNTVAVLERDNPVLLGYETLGALGRWQPGMVDGDFGKLRTVSLTYRVPEAIAGRIGASRASINVSAENMITLWAQEEVFGHPLVDPERVNQTGGATAGLSSFLQESWPMMRRFLTTIRVGF